MQETNVSWFRRYRTVFAGIAAVVVVLGLLALPPVRAIADQFLMVFRAQRVMFVPVSSERMDQIEGLDFDGSTLFIGEPEVLQEPAPPRVADSLEEAAAEVGYAVHQPTIFPTTPLSTEHMVRDSGSVQFQVNVDASRELLDLLDIQDVTIPEELGEHPITVGVSAWVGSEYSGEDYHLTLLQGHTPDVTLPDGVDLAQLGKAALRVLGMTPEQAETLSRQIDWSTTLIFPFPSDIDTVSQVTIGEAQGVLMRTSGEYGPRAHQAESQIYWQVGERFYILQASGRGFGGGTLLEIAESVR